MRNYCFIISCCLIITGCSASKSSIIEHPNSVTAVKICRNYERDFQKFGSSETPLSKEDRAYYANLVSQYNSRQLNEEGCRELKRQATQRIANALIAFGDATSGYTYTAPSPQPYNSKNAAVSHTNRLTLCPNGQYVYGGNCQITPNGDYVSGANNSIKMCPDGSFVSGNNCLSTPSGGYVSGSYGALKLCPDGSYVAGKRCLLTPEGSYVGAPD